MFTGLVEEMGTIQKIDADEESCTLTISASKALEDVNFGDSIAVNGVCLSVTEFSKTHFSVGLATETRRLTSLDGMNVGDPVNLERSVLPTTRLGGHYVQGHVDGVGKVSSVKPDGDALMVSINTDPALMRYIVRKGYVAVDGTSLTVIDTGEDWFSLTLINHTQPLVVLGKKKTGDTVNIEVDIMAKYAEKIIAARREI